MDVKGVEKDTLNAFMDGPFLQWVRKAVIFLGYKATFVNPLHWPELVRGKILSLHQLASLINSKSFQVLEDLLLFILINLVACTLL